MKTKKKYRVDKETAHIYWIRRWSDCYSWTDFQKCCAAKGIEIVDQEERNDGDD